jgi:tetratricopeptide (TPR) repeat protein
MTRAFLDVFPNAVLLSGASSNFILIGSAGADVRIDPARLAAALARAPAVQRDLERLDLGSLREIIGMFAGSAQTLTRATRGVVPVSDDRPIQEYAKRSLIDDDEGVPPSIIDVGDVAAWCPACFANGQPVPLVEGLDTYLALMNLAYTAPPIGAAQTVPAGTPGRTIAGSGYLGAIVPDSTQLRAVIADAFTRRYQRGTDLLHQGQYEEAVDQFREALRLVPDAVQAHNNLGVALASEGKVDEASDHFRRALALQPDFDDARRNLAAAVDRRR